MACWVLTVAAAMGTDTHVGRCRRPLPLEHPLNVRRRILHNTPIHSTRAIIVTRWGRTLLFELYPLEMIDEHRASTSASQSPAQNTLLELT